MTSVSTNFLCSIARSFPNSVLKKKMESVHTRSINVCLFCIQSHWILSAWTSQNGFAFCSNSPIQKSELIANQNQNLALLLTRGANKFSPCPKYPVHQRFKDFSRGWIAALKLEHLKLWPLSWISLNPQAGWAFIFPYSFSIWVMVMDCERAVVLFF